jgi:hypothetical protein
MINTYSIVGIHLPKIVSCPKYIHDCIPCNEANINAFQHYCFVSKEVMVELLMNIKEEVALEVLTTFLKKLRSGSVNLCTWIQLNIVLPRARVAWH